MIQAQTAAAPLALTLGDPDGIGPEIALKAWKARRDSGAVFVLVGDPGRLQTATRCLDLPRPEPIESASQAREVFADALPVLALEPSSSAPAAAKASIECAVGLALEGQVSGLVTCPISKARLYEEGFTFPGHTEFIDHLTMDNPAYGLRGPVMMLSGGGLRTVLVSIHVSLREAIERLSVETIIRTARITAEALRRDFGLNAPRLAIAGLNPHAGEDGALGEEDRDIVAPAVSALRGMGLDVIGPLPPDTMFHAEARTAYDAAVCLYHDQGLIPVKTLDFHGGVNVTLGLPVVRTSPDHGTAFDIAGQGIARADSLIAAINLAAEVAANRTQFDHKAAKP